METTLQAYRGAADHPRMIALARAAASETIHVPDLPYRLSAWALDVRENVAIREAEDGEPAAWAVLNTPFWAIDYAIHPAVGEEVHRQILEWADARVLQTLGTPYGHPMWFINVRADQEARIETLERMGFADQANVSENPWSKRRLARSVHPQIDNSRLPDGVTIRSFAGAEEVEASVALHRAAFDSENMTTRWRSRLLRAPGYLPDLDRVAVQDGGRLIGFCISWFDAGSPNRPASGEIEPTGVHPDFQKQGIGRALLADAVRQLGKQGAETIFVKTDFGSPALAHYLSAGFEIVEEIRVFRKEYG